MNPEPIITNPFIAGWLWGLFTGIMGVVSSIVTIRTIVDALQRRYKA